MIITVGRMTSIGTIIRMSTTDMKMIEKTISKTEIIIIMI